MKDEIIYKGKSTIDGSIVYGNYLKEGSYNFITTNGVNKIPVHPYSISIVGKEKKLHVIYLKEQWAVLDWIANIILSSSIHREEAYHFAMNQKDIDKVVVHKKNGTIRFVSNIVVKSKISLQQQKDTGISYMQSKGIINPNLIPLSPCRVRIVTCSYISGWYNELIGEEFDTDNPTGMQDYVLWEDYANNRTLYRHIKQSDCEIVHSASQARDYRSTFVKDYENKVETFKNLTVTDPTSLVYIQNTEKYIEENKERYRAYKSYFNQIVDMLDKKLK